MKFILAVSVATLLVVSQAGDKDKVVKEVCYGLQVNDAKGKCVCPQPLINGVKGDYNCYCGVQEFDNAPTVKVLARQEFLGDQDYTCVCYLDDKGRQNIWDAKKKQCVPVKLKKDDKNKH